MVQRMNVVHIEKYSSKDFRVTYIFSQRPTVNSLATITAQTHKCTKTYKRVLRVLRGIPRSLVSRVPTRIKHHSGSLLDLFSFTSY